MFGLNLRSKGVFVTHSNLRSKGDKQEDQPVRTRYPRRLDDFIAFLEAGSITEKSLKKQFKLVCERLRNASLARYATLKRPASGETKGRLLGDEVALRNNLRRNVYIVLNATVELEGWGAIETALRREAPGKRPTSQWAKTFTDLLHFVLREHKDADPVVLTSAAINDT